MLPSIVTDMVTVLTLVIILVAFLTPPFFLIWLYFKNKKQAQHSLLRGKYWLLGILRYLIENVGPEFRFYITDEDNSGRPISRIKFVSIVKAAKYQKTLISFGSKRDFQSPGMFIKNSMFPRLNEELEVDNKPLINSRKYDIQDESIFFRTEKMVDNTIQPWLLTENNYIHIGTNRKYPWAIKGLIGVSGMSYGALGPHAIRALSLGVGLAGGSWMNTGEGGISTHHLEGNCDIIYQIGPGLYGVRNKSNQMDWEMLKEKASLEQVKAIELKLGQGAKIRGGHLEGSKVTPEIAELRGIESWKTIDSPNRFLQFSNVVEMFDFVERVQQESGLPVGIKVVVGDNTSIDDIAMEFAKRGNGPDFVTLDGGEGGTGATFKELADSLGLPIYSAITIADDAFRKYGVRDKLKIIVAGRLHLPDEHAIALGMGADLVAGARSFMITVGCIMTESCHTNNCPVGVSTTNKKSQRLLYVDEKKYRTLNYIVAARAGLFAITAACGLKSPTELKREHLVFKDDRFKVHSIDDLYPLPGPVSKKAQN